MYSGQEGPSKKNGKWTASSCSIRGANREGNKEETVLQWEPNLLPFFSFSSLQKAITFLKELLN